MDMEIVYYEQEGGVLQKVAEFVVQTRNGASLDELCREALKERQDCDTDTDLQLKCYSSLFAGEESVEIDLSKQPNEVDCILEALHNDTRPVLYLFKEPSQSEVAVEEEGEREASPFSRKGSGMVKDFISHTPRHSRLTPPINDDVVSPVHSIEEGMNQLDQNGTGTDQEHTHELEEDIHSHHTIPHKFKPENRILEQYHSQNDIIAIATTQGHQLKTSLSADSVESSNTRGGRQHHFEARSVPLLHTRDSYRELLTILEAPSDSDREALLSPTPPQFRPKLDTVVFSDNASNKPKTQGFLTVQRRSKNPLLSREQHFNDFSRMSESYGYEGPPSPQLKDRFSILGDGGHRGRGEEGEETRTRLGSRNIRKFKRKTAIRRQRRKVGGSISELPPETSYNYHVEYIQVSADSQTVHKIQCREYHTIGEIKECVMKTLNRHREQERDGKWKTSDVVLIYSLNEQEYELFNEYQFLYSTAIYQSWADEGSTISPENTIIRVRSAGRMGDKDGKITSRLSHLTGLVLDDYSLCQNGMETGSLWSIADGDKREVEWARRLLHSYVKSEVAARDEESYCLSMELVSRQTSTILALKIPLDNKVEITFHYQQIFSLVKRVNVHRTAISVLEELYQCVVACGLIDQEKSQTSDYVLQVSGERSYIAGQNELLSFKDIRRCIIKEEPIHLSISHHPNPDKDLPIGIHMIPIDVNSGLPPLHTDITALSHKECESQALSIWDVKDELSLHVVQLDHLPVRSMPSKTPVIVDVALYHGATQLCDSSSTTPQPVNGLLRIKETITFKIAKKDVPKSAKLMFTVRDAYPRKESTNNPRKSSTGRFLYWGLVAITDHQNMLRVGEVQVALWKAGSRKESEDCHDPNPCAPAYNNPNPKTVMLTVKFDSYSFPVYYPSTTPQSWTSLLGLNEGGNTALRKQFLRLLDLIKEGKLHSALPMYIEKLEWSNLSKTLEVYSLLTELMEAKHFPVETALKMLDGNFPDEHVRKFAVNALHELADDDLEDLLLQLTQALKFEPRHDSPLARLLLKRALHNKRIGHFLFWFLKCELHNPLYALRCGVILEAYLKGCGEAMLRQFEDQVDIQMKLEEIAVELKQRCADDHGKMQSLLPELLEAHGVPTFTLTPVYNPRIRLGNLRPNKCKVMSSKKKPQWLEMYNVDPTVLRQSPTRLILKIGDDLRQDMITLRMFSLFEKLWEEDGLSDLCLIPYGCMATGPKTGFIEVVNNARTIAEVSGVSNQTKLLEWIKSHQTNEFRELDSEKLKLAVKKFTHSCAGYSVATYVLGIGDRHNDNIMVTTSGNLFHIDFGHFLGNIKYYMGFKREWAPFVLTPDFVHVMGGEEGAMFETYKNLCCRAFLTLRRNSDLIINLFSLMRSTGIPELTCVEDTDYIKNALLLDKTEQEAEQLFRKVIKKCLDLKWTVQMMWKIHLLRKKGTP